VEIFVPRRLRKKDEFLLNPVGGMKERKRIGKSVHFHGCELSRSQIEEVSGFGPAFLAPFKTRRRRDE